MDNNLQQYLDYIFKYFDGLRANQGGYFTRNIYNDRSINQEFRNHTFDVLNVLIQNDIIYADDPKGTLPFIKITQSGYDFLQGGDLPLRGLSLFYLIDLSQSSDYIYNRLWDFIGNDKTAPFYLKGSWFFNVIAPYVGLSSHTYSSYTKERVEKGESATRNVWFRELFVKLKPEELEPFLRDLSNKIIEIYQPLYTAPIESDDELDEILNAEPVSFSNDALPTLTSLVDSKRTDSKKKVIFISYTWETSITPNHKEWVRHLADRLQSDGFDVRLDQYQPLGTEMNHFMTTSVTEADRIILICSPTFKQKSDHMQDASGFEASMISNDLIKDITRTKFLPIFRIGEPKECMPNYLGNRNGLIWHENDDDKAKYAVLVEDLRKN